MLKDSQISKSDFMQKIKATISKSVYGMVKIFCKVELLHTKEKNMYNICHHKTINYSNHVIYQKYIYIYIFKTM